MIGLYDPTSTHRIDQILAKLPPDLKKFASGIDYRPVQLASGGAETPEPGSTGEDSNEAEEEPSAKTETEEVTPQQSTSNQLQVSVDSPAGLHRSDQAHQFIANGEVATATISWILRSAGLRA